MLLAAVSCTSLLDFDGYDYAVPASGGAAPSSTSSNANGSGGDGGESYEECASNGAKDRDETGIDCGGRSCPPCDNGMGCMTDDDCISGSCNAGTCVSCQSNGECDRSEWCNAGVCTPRKMLGESCSTNSECLDNDCADGICCNDRCEGTCRSCLGAKTGGSDGNCLDIPQGQDPDDECESSDTCDGSGICNQCDMTPVAPGGGCPGACASCNGNVCNIVCTSTQPCNTVTCPSGFDCNVSCNGTSACMMATINCSAYQCTVTCSGSEACKEANINCGAGACHVSCGSGGDVCSNTDVSCGAEMCTCDSMGGAPQLACGPSCGCVPC